MRLYDKFVDRFQVLSKVQNHAVSNAQLLSHWPCFTFKFLMVWFQKVLKLIFQKQQSCSWHICTEHRIKPPTFNDSVENIQKSFFNCPIHLFLFYFIGSGRSSLFEFSFWLSLAILLSKFVIFQSGNLLNSSYHFWKHSIPLQILHHSLLSWHTTFQYI